MVEAMGTVTKPKFIVRKGNLEEVRNEEVYQEWEFVARCKAAWLTLNYLRLYTCGNNVSY